MIHKNALLSDTYPPLTAGMAKGGSQRLRGYLLSHPISRILCTSAFCALAFGLLAPLPVAHAKEGAERVSISYSEPCPTGNLKISQPTVAWKIMPQGRARVTGVSLSINNKAVRAQYVESRQSVSYTPDQPLAPGNYRVLCEVTINNAFPFRKEWQFTIAPNAAQLPVLPAMEQNTTLDIVNSVRRDMNLPPAIIDARLCAAAKGHSVYIVANKQMGHGESPNRAHFTGTDAGARTSAQGYSGGCYENISQGDSTPQGAVRRLLDAPYHRGAFLQPGTFDFGAGTEKTTTTFLFGMGDQAGVSTYPIDRQKNVPVSWDGLEMPNPLRLYRVQENCGPVGYPITLFAFGSGETVRLTHVTATLTNTSTNKPVAVFVNSPDNDDFLTNGVLLIPTKPLQSGTTYRASVQANDADGAPVTRAWTFATAR